MHSIPRFLLNYSSNILTLAATFIATPIKKFTSRLLKNVWMVVVFGLLCAGCGSDDKKYENRNLLEHNSKLWHSHALSNYQYHYIAQCFCPDVRELVIEVEDNRVSRVFYVDSGEYVAEDRLEDLYTVEGLFALAEKINSENPHRLDITYNATYGYPEIISVDYVENIADDEITYRAWDLR